MKIDRKKLELAMARRCLNANALSKAAGVSTGALSRIMNSARPVRTATVGNLANALGVDPVEIIETEVCAIGTENH